LSENRQIIELCSLLLYRHNGRVIKSLALCAEELEFQAWVSKLKQLPRFHVPFWLSHFLVYLLYLCSSFSPN